MVHITQRDPQKGMVAGNRHGFALLVVIVVLLLVSFLASQLIFDVRTEQRIARNARERSQAAVLAMGGFNIALFRLMDKPMASGAEQEYGRMVPGREYLYTLKGGRGRYYATNESGKIDLNAADPRLLELFLRHRKLSLAQATVVLDALLDWRDTDDLPRMNGAEKDYYLGLSEPYMPRNGRIEDPAEFFLLKGTAPLAGGFAAEDVFTVHNSEGKINVNALGPAMLDFVVEGDAGRRQAYLEARQADTVLDAAMARQIFGAERFAALEPFLRYDDGAAALYYTITATGQAALSPEAGTGNGGGTELTIHALVRLLANGYQILSWQERPS